MNDQERYTAIEILNQIDIFVSLDSLKGYEREQVIRLIAIKLRGLRENII